MADKKAAPGAPRSAVRTLGRTGLGEEAAEENRAAAVAAAAGAGAGAAEPQLEETRLAMLKAYSRNLEKYRNMLADLGIDSRRVEAKIAEEGNAMDAAKVEKAQKQNQIMRECMEEVTGAKTDEEKRSIIAKMEAKLAALDAKAPEGGRRRRRGRGSKTTKRRNHHHRKRNTRRHR